MEDFYIDQIICCLLWFTFQCFCSFSKSMKIRSQKLQMYGESAGALQVLSWAFKLLRFENFLAQSRQE